MSLTSDKRLIMIIMGIVISCVSFCGIVFWDAQKVVKINPSDYQSGGPIKYGFDEISVHGNVQVVQGWAVHEGENIETFDTSVVLYDCQKGQYYKIPSKLVIRDDITASLADGFNYDNCGFYSSVLCGKMNFESTKYQMCIAYENNAEQYLVLTDQYIGGNCGSE